MPKTAAIITNDFVQLISFILAILASINSTSNRLRGSPFSTVHGDFQFLIFHRSRLLGVEQVSRPVPSCTPIFRQDSARFNTIVLKNPTAPSKSSTPPHQPENN